MRRSHILKITDKFLYKLPLYTWSYHQGIDESILERWFTHQEITNIDESGDPAKKTGLRSQGYVGLYNILITRVAERNYKKMMDEIDTYITTSHTGRAAQQAVLLADVIQRAIFLPETTQNTYMPNIHSLLSLLHCGHRSRLATAPRPPPASVGSRQGDVHRCPLRVQQDPLSLPLHLRRGRAVWLEWGRQQMALSFLALTLRT